MFNIMEFQYPFYFQKLVNKILIYMYRLSKKDQVVIGLNNFLLNSIKFINLSSRS